MKYRGKKLSSKKSVSKNCIMMKKKHPKLWSYMRNIDLLKKYDNVINLNHYRFNTYPNSVLRLIEFRTFTDYQELLHGIPDVKIIKRIKKPGSNHRKFMRFIKDNDIKNAYKYFEIIFYNDEYFTYEYYLHIRNLLLAQIKFNCSELDLDEIKKIMKTLKYRGEIELIKYLVEAYTENPATTINGYKAFMMEIKLTGNKEFLI